VFVGDVGRPDLLERVAAASGTMEQGARTLFRSLQSFKQLPGHVMLWPGHGAGSACGKSLGGVPVTTVAYEMLANWGLRATDEDAFVAEVLQGQPDPPTYFREMKRINKSGPPSLGGLRVPPRLDPESALAAIEGGAAFVDLRKAAEFARGFIPGVLHIPAGGLFTTWAGWLLPYDRPVYLLSGNEADVAACARDLALIGIDDVRGWAMTATVINGWTHRHGAPETLARIGFSDAVERMRRGELVLLDVRSRAEYRAGHVPGVTHIPLGHLAARVRELTQTLPIVVHCAAGDRSPIAASVLRRLGFVAIADVAGGFSEYTAAGLPVETGEPAEVSAR
jgi:hydroxyacylglutathione hydrolase